MEEDISLEEIAGIIKKKRKTIIFSSLLGLLLASLYTFFIVTPQYQSSLRLVVNQTQNTNQIITNTDIQTNLNLINTYQSIIKEPIILENVIEDTEIETSIDNLRSKIKVDTETNSLVFGVSVTDKDPYAASELANAVAVSFQEKIGDILDVESVTILSQATPNLSPVSPNITLNLIFGVILGLILGVSLAFLSELTDKRVQDNKIFEDLGWTNLGSVLEMSVTEIKETRIVGKMNNNRQITSISRRRI